MRFSSFKPRASSPSQYALQLAQVFFVGLTLGMTRTVVPAVAESDFGVPRGDLALVAAFVIAFGIVKGAMNFIAGALSETFGRKRVLVVGWIVALPIPWMIWHAPRVGGWNWIVAATVLLGVNQGLTWSMTLTSNLDLTRSDQRGLTNGLNEFFGYFAVAGAGVITGYLSDWLGPRLGLLIFGLAVTIPALLMAVALVRETRPVIEPGAAQQVMHPMKVRAVFLLSLRERTFFAICQAGMFEKFIDALMWIVLPLFQVQRGVDLQHIGWVPGLYTVTWGIGQLFTGPLSDRIGRKVPIMLGMLLCAVAAGALPVLNHGAWWGACATATGLGMALLYPTLGAAVSDVADPAWRGTALGVYRFWRDLGYAIGATALALLAHFGLGDDLTACFWMVGAIVGLSGLVVWISARETGPPAAQVPTM